MSDTNRSSVAIWTDRWKLASTILAFLVGVSILVFDAIINPPADPVTSGIGLVLTGLGPAAALDLLRGKTGT